MKECLFWEIQCFGKLNLISDCYQHAETHRPLQRSLCNIVCHQSISDAACREGSAASNAFDFAANLHLLEFDPVISAKLSELKYKHVD